jgi:hypothetical protein
MFCGMFLWKRWTFSKHRAILMVCTGPSQDVYHTHVQFRAMQQHSYNPLTQRLSNCGPRTTSGPRIVLVALLDWTLVKKKKRQKK